MLQFDITQNYSLYEVFERTGKLMFPEDWTGREIWSRPIENPNPIKLEREELSANLINAVRRKAEIESIDQRELSQSFQNELQKCLYAGDRELQSGRN